jgi:O-methyltransferase involved in polyketide biosynthesis
MGFLRIDEKYTIEHVAENYKKQYFERGTWHNWNGKSSSERYNMLAKATTIEELESIIGNETWTTETCMVCNKRVRNWFNITGYDEIVSVCDNCIKDMGKMVKE